MPIDPPGVRETFVLFEYAPPPPPVDAELLMPPAPPPIHSTVLSALFQSDGTV
jgi:hypothetical protein